MKLYQEPLLPEFCLISEAPFWVALGRLPEAIFEDDDDGVDVRRSLQRIDNEELFAFFEVFAEEEFRALTIEVDYERYFQARDTYPIPGSGAYYVKRELESYKKRFGQPPKEDTLRDIEQFGKEVDWAIEMERPFEPMMDIARAKIFQALAAGDFNATGWIFEVQDWNSQEYQSVPNRHLGEFAHIPREHWTLRGIDWSSCILEHKRQKYYVVQLRFADLIKKFPIPEIEPLEMPGQLYGTTLIADGKPLSAPRRRTKGRPVKQIVSVGTVITNEFMARFKRGELPDKKEAIVQEAIDWASAVLEQPISRSAAQRYLAPVLRIAPENDAQK